MEAHVGGARLRAPCPLFLRECDGPPFPDAALARAVLPATFERHNRARLCAVAGTRPTAPDNTARRVTTMAASAECAEQRGRAWAPATRVRELPTYCCMISLQEHSLQKACLNRKFSEHLAEAVVASAAHRGTAGDAARTVDTTLAKVGVCMISLQDHSGDHSAQLFCEVSRVVVSKIEEFNPQNLAITAWGSTRASPGASPRWRLPQRRRTRPTAPDNTARRVTTARSFAGRIAKTPCAALFPGEPAVHRGGQPAVPGDQHAQPRDRRRELLARAPVRVGTR